ncbi:hypothetical protein FRB99_005557 [Tulasnella sp. 403]|nr:hypothetical protein FRB99_005557 [Tulasnella sp. 403]
MLAISTAFVLALIHVARVYGLSPQDLAASYNLTSTSALVFPPSPIDNTGAANYIVNNSNWNVPRITENPQDVAFVADPFPNASPNVQNSNASPSNASATVLQVNYPQGSFSHDTGGVQFSNIYDESGTAGYQTMVLTYEVAFDQNFQFVKGAALLS